MSEKVLPFGRYELVRQVGRGGMAEIYEARLRGPGGFEKRVAIKRILPQWTSDADFVRMLIDEAKVLTHLIHPNIVNVYDLGMESQELYIAMEYVPGSNLKEYLKICEKRGVRIPLPISLYLVQHVLRGLEYAHHRKDREGNPLAIVHRDVSPQNILVSNEGDVKITDFGIAKAMDRSSEVSQAGGLKGKFAYMSPEQARGEAVDGRSDLFAVGLILYECVTGSPYFKGGNDLSILEAVKTHRVSALSDRMLADFPPDLLGILGKALAEDPSARYQSAGLFLNDVTQLFDTCRFDPEKSGQWTDPAVYFEDLLRDRPPDPGAWQELTRTKTPSFKTLVLAGDKEQRVEKEEPRRQSAPAWPSSLLKIFKQKTWVRAAIAIGLSLGVLLWLFSLDIFEKKPVQTIVRPLSEPDRVPVPPEENLTVEVPVVMTSPPVVEKTEPVVPEETVEKKEEKEEAVSPELGRLKVNAIPWGLVTGVGIGGRYEAPFARQLPVGSYPIAVTYNGRTLRATALVKTNVETVCKANFVPGKEGVVCQ